MQNILIISNDTQSQSVTDFFQPLVRGQINLVTDFDRGLKEVFDKRPVAVFIQSEIAGISGDAVAKHIKGLLRDDSPRLVLLRDAPNRPPASRHAFDDSIDLFLPLEEVLKLTRSQLEKVAGLELLEAAPPTIPPESAPSIAAQAPTVSPQRSETPEPSTAQHATVTPHRPAAPKPGTTQPTAKPAATHKSEPTQKRVSPPPRPAVAPAPGAAGSHAIGAGAIPPINATVETPPFEPGLKPRQTTSRIWLYLCILLALLLGGAFFFAPRWFGLKPKPAATANLPVGAGTGARPIPSIVPLNNRDAAYGTSRPGWDRYLSPTLEYLVFREQGNVKALQVIGRDGGNVPEPTVTALLRDAFHSASYTVKSAREQDGYLVEEGTISGKGEILFYRKKTPATIRAIVVTWP